MLDSVERFSSRVRDYIACRPSYPGSLIDAVCQRAGLGAGSAVADVGSGTGIASALFLDRGFTVYGVEPNVEMRRAAERLLGGHASFVSIDGRAEATTLADASVDLVVAAQAFHWFDHVQARREFARISTPRGFVALVWNERRVDGAGFSAAYEHLLRTHTVEYARVAHRDAVSRELIAAFFDGLPYETIRRENVQRFDLQGLEGRLRSTSYVPEPGDPLHAACFDAARDIFAVHARDGTVALEYDTCAFVGRLTP